MNGRERNLGALLWSFETSLKVSQSRRPSSISGMRFYCLLIGVLGKLLVVGVRQTFTGASCDHVIVSLPYTTPHATRHLRSRVT